MDRQEMHTEMLELVERCPLGERVPHCPFKIFEPMNLKSRIAWLDAGSEYRMKDYLFDHKFCYLSRTDRLDELENEQS